MVKKFMSIAFIAMVFVFASAWTFTDVPAPKVIVFEGEFDFSRTEIYSQYDDCAGEVIDFVINVHDWGTLVIYDDGSMHQNFHYNYFNSSGTGQTSGNSYQVVGAGHFNINSNVGSVLVITQQSKLICQGMGVVASIKADYNIVTNANGDVTVFRIGDPTLECR